MMFSKPIAGCMRWGKWGACFTKAEYAAAIENCVANDILDFDHADIYGNYTTEAEFGDALVSLPGMRHKIRLITKCGIAMPAENRVQHSIKSYNTTAKYIVSCVENSLGNFSTDYLDVLLIHRPNPLMHPEEVVAAIGTLKSQGKLLHFGVSNFLPHQVDLLKNYVTVDCNQLEISITHLEPFMDGQLDYCLTHQISPLAWSPLGGNLFRDHANERHAQILKTAATLALKYNMYVDQILVAWLCQHPSNIVPVLGTTKISRLAKAKEASALRMENEDWFLLYQASLGHEVP
jgi:predicted oxidoreductase